MADAAPATASALSQEFSDATVGDVVAALSNQRQPRPVSPLLSEAFDPNRLGVFLRSSDGRNDRDVIAEQASLFEEHFRSRFQSGSTVFLVDSGLYGTTQALINEGFHDVRVGSLLFARTVRRGRRAPAASGLSVQADVYAPWRRRTCVLRYWHLIEEMLEPALPSVRSFALEEGSPISNLEVEGWQNKVVPASDTLFGGAMSHIAGLREHSVEQLALEAGVAWRRLHRAIVWPNRDDSACLSIPARSHDFGRAGAVTSRTWAGPLAALSGKSLWREGEIARSGTAARIPLLCVIEAAYAARAIKRNFG